MPFYIIIAAIWLYPVIGLGLIYFTRSKPAIQGRLFLTLASLNLFTLVGLLIKVSTTLKVMDWILLTLPYLLLSTGLWWAWYRESKFVKLFAGIAMILLFGVGYGGSSHAMIAIAIRTVEYDGKNEQWLENGYICKEFILGNALTDYRGKRLVVSQTLPWFPILEREITSNEYFDLAVYLSPISVEYDSDRNTFLMEAQAKWGAETLQWTDSLQVKNNEKRNEPLR